jgi:hypothetical protein
VSAALCSKDNITFYQQRTKLSDDVFQKLFYNFNRCFRAECLLKGRYQPSILLPEHENMAIMVAYFRGKGVE